MYFGVNPGIEILSLAANKLGGGEMRKQSDVGVEFRRRYRSAGTVSRARQKDSDIQRRPLNDLIA